MVVELWSSFLEFLKTSEGLVFLQLGLGQQTRHCKIILRDIYAHLQDTALLFAKWHFVRCSKEIKRNQNINIKTTLPIQESPHPNKASDNRFPLFPPWKYKRKTPCTHCTLCSLDYSSCSVSYALHLVSLWAIHLCFSANSICMQLVEPMLDTTEAVMTPESYVTF